MEWTPDNPFQCLALTGGGYRGLFTARALAIIEQECGSPVGRCFDLTCGTSIGGILALAVAFEVPMSQVVSVFESHGSIIFPAHQRPTSTAGKLWDLFQYRSKPKYDAGALRDVVAALIPANAILGDALHPVAIPAVNVTEGKPQVFKTRHVVEWNRDWKLKVVDIALATSAAPTFFQLAEISNNLYVDGGLFANAPDLVGLHEAEHFLGVSTAAFRLLSIGTTTQNYSISYAAGRDFGISEWMAGARLLNVIISSQQQFVEQLMRHKLADRYVRIDHIPSDEQANDLGLDSATEAARKTLLGLAEKSVTDILGTTLSSYLKHQPQLTIHRE
jgi:predicted acylesterase/phospholipase RssA